MREMQLSALNLRQLAEATALMGIPLPHRLKSLMAQHSLVEGQESWLSSDELDACYVELIAESGRADLGLQLAFSPAVMRFSVVSTLVLNAPSLSEALDNIARFAPLLQDESELSISLEGSKVVVHIDPICATEVGQICRTEFVALGLTHVLRVFGAGQSRLIRLDFAYPAPSHVAQYKQYFDAPLHFEQRRTCLVFDRDILNFRISGTDPMVYGSALTSATIALAEQRSSRGLVNRVSAELRKRIAQRPRMAEVARALGHSERSLRRHLSTAGVDYQRLLTRLQHEMACAHLAEHQLSIQQIAASLGFSQASAFHRAFLKWTGMTPKAWAETQSPRPDA